MRPPSRVMRLECLGALHQSRISFMRALLRDMGNREWRFSRPLWKINAAGVGYAVYRFQKGRRIYSLAVYAHDLPPDKRTDRVIAEAWDATFSLYDGALSAKTAEDMQKEVSAQEAGRQHSRQLVLSRANRSVRLFDYVVDALAHGRQPEAAKLDEVGYLMRTTAVYGNGKFGIADRTRIVKRAEMRQPFRAELLAVWVFRVFTLDWVEHLAKSRAPKTATRLNLLNRRRLGIGNSTGLGMAPFLINHPILLNQWMFTREFALARVRAAAITNKSHEDFMQVAEYAKAHVDNWQTSDKRQRTKITALKRDLRQIIKRALKRESPGYWDNFYLWGEKTLSAEGREMLLSLLLEPHGHLVDELADNMAVDEEAFFRIPGAVTVGQTRLALEKNYAWALAINFSLAAENARFWYVSADKMEPRLGECGEEAGVKLQLPLAVARDVSAFYAALKNLADKTLLADFLLRFPEHRHSARRAHIAEQCPYSEIRDNLVSARLLPIDMLRCKLSFFGATKFDPRSDRWLRITLYQNAPHPGDNDEKDDWIWKPLYQTQDFA